MNNTYGDVLFWRIGAAREYKSASIALGHLFFPLIVSINYIYDINELTVRFIMHKGLFYLLFFLTSLVCQEPKPADSLSEKDIHKVMEEIFHKHVRQREMNEKSLMEGIRAFITEFDPSRLYLLEPEYRVLIQESEKKLSELVSQYKNSDFTYFKELTHAFQGTIKRAIEFRAAQEKRLLQQEEEYEAYLSNTPSKEPEGFALSSEQLRDRWKLELHRGLFREAKRLGKARVLAQKKAFIDKFNQSFEESENGWLYLNHEGQPMSQKERDTLFAYHVLKALASTLDSHTKVFNPDEAYSLRSKLEKSFHGIGVVLEKSPQGGVLIKEILPNTPAEKSGLVHQGDRIIEVSGQPVGKMEFEEIVKLIHADAKEMVRLKIVRLQNGQEHLLAVEIPTSVIPLDNESIQVYEIPYGNGIIGAIRLDAFYQSDEGESAEGDLKKAIEQLEAKGLRGLILDLRFNGGGFLNQAVKVAGLFISNGIIVISKYADGSEKIYRDIDSRRQYEGPLVILVSRQTASAAEIVAQSLQDWGVALIVGDEHTFGKGTIQSQTVTDNSAASYFKVTVGTYYTVSGKTPQLAGVKSDIPIPGPLSFYKIGETYLENAIPSDKIQAEYEDPLEDVDAASKQWYLRYYLPSIQKKEFLWQKILPTLQEDSLKRQKQNPEYRPLLEKLQKKEKISREEESEMEHQQYLEAINVVKEMIYLESKVNR